VMGSVGEGGGGEAHISNISFGSLIYDLLSKITWFLKLRQIQLNLHMVILYSYNKNVSSSSSSSSTTSCMGLSSVAA
jgi:hypothetical protein